MSNKVTIEFLRRRLALVVAPLMGWKTEGNSKTVGRVFIEKVPFGARYRLVKIINVTGGERNLSENMTKAELLSWLDGCLFAAEQFTGRR